MGYWRFVQAKNYRAGRTAKARLIVMHTMETGETSNVAENVASWFAGANAPMASAHFLVDNDSIVQGVKGGDTAFAAPGANHDGVQIELAGRAGQSMAQWNDDYSERVLNWGSLVAAEVVHVCRWFGVDIPLRRLTPQQIRDGQRGFAGHIDITNAYKKSTHWDPGNGFPWDRFLGKVGWWLPQIKEIHFQ